MAAAKTDKTAKPNYDLGVEFVPAQNGTEAEVVAYDRDGNQILMPAKIVIKPYFNRSDARVPVGYFRLLLNVALDSERSRSILELGGKTGHLRLTDRSFSVPPAFLSGLTDVDDGDDED